MTSMRGRIAFANGVSCICLGPRSKIIGVARAGRCPKLRRSSDVAVSEGWPNGYVCIYAYMCAYARICSHIRVYASIYTNKLHLSVYARQEFQMRTGMQGQACTRPKVVSETNYPRLRYLVPVRLSGILEVLSNRAIAFISFVLPHREFCMHASAEFRSPSHWKIPHCSFPC